MRHENYPSTYVGRNDSCPCGSGIRYKHCHGSLEVEPGLVGPPAYGMPQALLDAKVREQVEMMDRNAGRWGRGRLLQSLLVGNQRLVLVGSKLIAIPASQTIANFLDSFLLNTLGGEWFEGEATKPEESRHPIAQWHQMIWSLVSKQGPSDLPQSDEQLVSVDAKGPIEAYLRLAWDVLYLHLNGATPEAEVNELLRRLRRRESFVSARQEINAGAMFIRAGATIVWEKEKGRGPSHGEFIATFPDVGKSYSVECRMRQPDDLGPVGDNTNEFGRRFVKALSKALPFERIVCVDLNASAAGTYEQALERLKSAIRRIALIERDPSTASLPSAYVIFTDIPHRHALDEKQMPVGAALAGFRKDGITADGQIAFEALERHQHIRQVVESAVIHGRPPESFD